MTEAQPGPPGEQGAAELQQVLQRAKLDEQGFPAFEIVQSNISFNSEVGVTRGVHAEPWEKFISLAQSRAFAAIVDLRAGATFGRIETFELNPGNAIFDRAGVAIPIRRSHRT